MNRCPQMQHLRLPALHKQIGAFEICREAGRGWPRETTCGFRVRTELDTWRLRLSGLLSLGTLRRIGPRCGFSSGAGPAASPAVVAGHRYFLPTTCLLDRQCGYSANGRDCGQSRDSNRKSFSIINQLIRFLTHVCAKRRHAAEFADSKAMPVPCHAMPCRVCCARPRPMEIVTTPGSTTGSTRKNAPPPPLNIPPACLKLRHCGLHTCLLACPPARLPAQRPSQEQIITPDSLTGTLAACTEARIAECDARLPSHASRKTKPKPKP